MITGFTNAVVSIELDADPSDPKTKFRIKPLPYGVFLDLQARTAAMEERPDAKDAAEQLKVNAEWEAIYRDCIQASLVGIADGGGSFEGLSFPLSAEALDAFMRTKIAIRVKLSSGTEGLGAASVAALLFWRIFYAQTLTLPERRSLLGAGVDAGGPGGLRPSGQAALPGA